MAEKYPGSPEQCGPRDQTENQRSTYNSKAKEGIAEPSESEFTRQHQSRIIDQSASTEKQQHGLVTNRPISDSDQSETTDRHHVQVQPDFADLLQQFPQALHTGAATVNLIQTQYNVSGDRSVIQGTQHNVAGGQTVIGGDHNVATIGGDQNKAKMTTGDHTKPLTSEVPLGHAKTLNLTKCQEELRISYLEEFGRINLLPWIPEETKDMDSIFVDLELVRKEGQSYHKIECNEELVNLKRNRGQRINRVLITGDAGGGKSTLLANIAYKWALNDPQSPLSKFSLVFILRMKDIESSSSSLVDLIFENILSVDTTVSKEGLGVYIRENAGDILFLIDGLDEDTCDVVKNKSGEVAQLLHNRIQRKSCAILTSRPENMNNLKEHVRHYLQVKLDGFSSSSIIEYITKFFGGDEKKISSLLVKIESEPHIKALLSIPVLLLMICVLWEDKSHMPKTKTQLYRETVRYMWKRYEIRSNGNPIVEDSEAEELKEDLKELLIKLGETALRNTSISGSRSTYTESDFGKDMCSLGCKVGILKQERTRLGLEKKTSVAFLHTTFLEFCAAFHIAFLLQSKKAQLDDFHGKVFDIQPDDIYYRSLIFEFCCGLHPQTTANLFQYHLHYADDSGFDIPIVWHLANIFESQFSFHQCENLLEIPRSLSFYLKITHSDVASVLYLLDLYRVSGSHSGILSAVNTLDITELGYTPPWIADLLTYTPNLKIYVAFVSSSTSANRDIMYRALSMLSNLSHVNLINASFIPHISYDITNMIQFFTEKRIQVVTLSWWGFHFDDKVMAKYLESISTSIAQLSLVSFPLPEIQCRTAKGVFAILPTLKQLTFLVLSAIQISSGIKHLRPIIRQLEELGLICCRLKEKHLKELLTFLNRAKKLKKLYLSGNDGLFSGSLVDTFVDTMNQLPALEELHVHGSGLNEESELILLKFAKVKPSMCFLYLQLFSPIDVQRSHDDNPATSF